MSFSLGTNNIVPFSGSSTGLELKLWLSEHLNVDSDEWYLIFNGKRVSDDTIITNNSVHVIPKLKGGKGGFGSMLRAIGAQIEKTTNREACRDLSGRRLRDINEEKRLKQWINQQAEREKEAKEKRQKKLEKLCEKPRHEFKDEEYEKERSVLPEIVEDAVLQGLQASCSSKRKLPDTKNVPKTKRPKLWVDDELDISSDSGQSDTEEREINTDNTNNSDTNYVEQSSTSVSDAGTIVENTKSADSIGPCCSKDTTQEDKPEDKMCTTQVKSEDQKFAEEDKHRNDLCDRI